jgi:hypothetical protein
MTIPENTDFRSWITLPAWLRRPETVPEGQHQLSILARALGAVFNGIRDRILAIRRQWIAATATGMFLEEHGKDRSVFIRDGESEADFRERVLAAQRAKQGGGTKAAMRIALDTLGLKNYELLELYRLDVDDVNDKRWNVFEVRYPDEGNEGLTDAHVLERIVRAKPPRATGLAVRYQGAAIQGYGLQYGTRYGG